MPPKSIILMLRIAPGLETSAMDELGHFLTHECPAESPRLHHDSESSKLYICNYEIIYQQNDAIITIQKRT